MGNIQGLLNLLYKDLTLIWGKFSTCGTVANSYFFYRRIPQWDWGHLSTWSPITFLILSMIKLLICFTYILTQFKQWFKNKKGCFLKHFNLMSQMNIINHACFIDKWLRCLNEYQ